jgi:transposase
MAAHIETGTMVDPRYESRHLGHLGLVAGIFDELGLGEAIDRLIPQDHERRIVSVGQAVKAMVLNGLGFVNQRLYLVPHFFQDKPTERLIGAGIGPEHLNDDVTGRALEKLYEHDVTLLYARLASQAVRRLGLTPRFGHLDTTSFHVDGQYNSETEPEAGVIHITRGYSRDHRADLNQVVLELMAENQAGIPLWMEPLSGNAEDKTSLRATVKAHLGQLKRAEGLDYVVADSALYTAETLRELEGMAWITRVPETLSAAREAIAAAAPGLMASPEKLSLQRQEADYAGVKQRWVVVYSPQAYQRALKSVNRHCEKQSEADLKAFEALCRRDFACAADAQKALAAFEKGRWLCAVADVTVVEVAHHGKRGRPRQGQPPKTLTYRLEGALISRPEQRRLRLQRKSCFILATNELDTEALSDDALLAAYKGQQQVERGFRFLKDPLFLASSLYLKSPKRLMALMMVMTLCLLVYAALEYRLRQALKAHGQTLPNQKGKPIQNPTLRWVFQLFVGIHLLLIQGVQVLMLNLNDLHRQVVGILGPPYETLYS